MLKEKLRKILTTIAVVFWLRGPYIQIFLLGALYSSYVQNTLILELVNNTFSRYFETILHKYFWQHLLLGIGGIFSGILLHALDTRKSLLFCGVFLFLYSGSHLSYTFFGYKEIVLFGYLFSSLGNSLLWTTVGTMLTTYPTEGQLGKVIALFFTVVNTVKLACLFLPQSLMNSFDKQGNIKVSFWTYVFLGGIGLSTILSLIIATSKQVTRWNESKPRSLEKRTFKNYLTVVKRDLSSVEGALIIVTMFLWHMHHSSETGQELIEATRDLHYVEVCRGLFSILFLLPFGFFLDTWFTRRTRGLLGLVVITLLGTWTLVCKSNLLSHLMDAPLYGKINGYFGTLGAYNSLLSLYIIWIIGQSSDDPLTASTYFGISKTIQVICDVSIETYPSILTYDLLNRSIFALLLISIYITLSYLTRSSQTYTQLPTDPALVESTTSLSEEGSNPV